MFLQQQKAQKILFHFKGKSPPISWSFCCRARVFTLTHVGDGSPERFCSVQRSLAINEPRNIFVYFSFFTASTPRTEAVQKPTQGRWPHANSTQKKHNRQEPKTSERKGVSYDCNASLTAETLSDSCILRRSGWFVCVEDERLRWKYSASVSTGLHLHRWRGLKSALCKK